MFRITLLPKMRVNTLRKIRSQAELWYRKSNANSAQLLKILNYDSISDSAAVIHIKHVESRSRLVVSINNRIPKELWGFKFLTGFYWSDLSFVRGPWTEYDSKTKSSESQKRSPHTVTSKKLSSEPISDDRTSWRKLPQDGSLSVQKDRLLLAPELRKRVKKTSTQTVILKTQIPLWKLLGSLVTSIVCSPSGSNLRMIHC